MQSTNYVPGVSGWKLSKCGSLEIEGVVRVAGIALAEPPKCIIVDGLTYVRRAEQINSEQKPFIVVNGMTCISEAEVERALIAGAKISDLWSVKMQINAQGQYVAAGIGLGIQEKQPTEFEKALAKGASALLEFLARTISDTQLRAELKGRAPSSIAEQVRDAIRAEIRPGGLLHRN